tara:strand:- start:1458 stop:1646 length:189 start_codon:yes stop_codon:yes gene_type:complete
MSAIPAARAASDGRSRNVFSFVVIVPKYNFAGDWNSRTGGDWCFLLTSLVLGARWAAPQVQG